MLDREIQGVLPRARVVEGAGWCPVLCGCLWCAVLGLCCAGQCNRAGFSSTWRTVALRLCCGGAGTVLWRWVQGSGPRPAFGLWRTVCRVGGLVWWRVPWCVRGRACLFFCSLAYSTCPFCYVTLSLLGTLRYYPALLYTVLLCTM